MKKVKERTGQYEVSVRAKNNNKYYEARISFKLGGVGNNPRLQKGGKSIELAVLSLLTALSEYIDICFKSGVIITKLDDMITAKLVKSINDLGILTPKVTEKTLEITKKINDINSNILNTFTLPNNVIPIYNQNLTANTTNLIPFPTPTNIIPTSTPAIHNTTNNVGSEPIQPIIIEDLADEWHKYRLSLCKKSEDNPNHLSQKTVDNNYKRLTKDILPYLKENKILYLSQLTDNCIKSLLKNIKSQNSKHKSYETLNLLFRYAIKEKNFTYNPMEKVDKPPEKIKTGEDDDNNYIEIDRQNIWLDLFEKENTDMSLLFETMLLSGIRPEEACGLKWKAFDLKNNELIINNAYKDFTKYDVNGKPIGHYRSDDKLKTPESYRKIPINPRLKNILLEHKKKQQERFKKSRAIKSRRWKWNENQYIFIGRNYYPYVPEDLPNGLTKFRIKYNLEYATPYSFRRGFATYWACKGMNKHMLMKLMGHSSFQTTVRHYIKISSSQIKKEMQRLEKAS